MNIGGETKKSSSIWLRLMPYMMWLLPVLVLNLGFGFLANIELHWKERELDETAQQELEALTRSSTIEYRLNRLAGLITEQIENAARSHASDAQLEQQLKLLGQTNFAAIFPKYRLHVFRKSPSNKSFELFHAQSGKIESKKAMAVIFNHLVDQHLGKKTPAAARKQHDKIAESYFGKTLRSDFYASSQKGKTTCVFQESHPNWFIWDFHNSIGNSAWGYMIASEVKNEVRTAAKKLALNDCRKRGNGLAGFIPVLHMNARSVLFNELEGSLLFNIWRAKEARSIDTEREYWLQYGPPPSTHLGNYKIYSHLGKETDCMTVFLGRRPVKSETPVWIQILNYLSGSIWILLVLRGLLLNHWIETRLTLRFLMLYFLATTFPLGLLTTTAAAYQYQTVRSSQNLIADNLEVCLRQIETRKMQIQEDYQKASRQLFADKNLAKLIADKGVNDSEVKARIVNCFKNRETPLPLLGFYLLDAGGKGIEYSENSALHRLRDIFSIYRAPIIETLRKQQLHARPGLILPEFKVPDEERLGAAAFASLSGKSLEQEIVRKRNFCISQYSGEIAAALIFDFLKIDGYPGAMLFVVWDGGPLFEKSISTAIDSFKLSFPDFSFVAFRNTTQGLRIHYRLENDELAQEEFSGTVKAAETAAARGGTVKNHLPGFSVVAMPFGQNSEIVIAGLADHRKIRENEARWRLIFVFLIAFSLLVAAICAWLASAFLLKPITGLKFALDKVSEGDYSICIDSSKHDELGKLTREFAQMVEGLKERKKLSSLLSDHAVEALAQNSGAKSDCDSKVFSGIALVSDIRSFTSLCETYPTDQITELLNQHFAAMAEAVASCDGRIYKFIGDAVEAVFEGDTETSAVNAFTAAIKMNAALAEINRRREAKGHFIYAFGVGLAYGNFYAGSIGSEDTRLDYSIIGEPFSRAAQLEASTKNCSGLPVIFDMKVAEMLVNRVKTVPVNNIPGAMTFAADDKLSADVTAQHSLTNIVSSKEIPTQSQADPVNPTMADSEYIFKLAAVTLFAVFAILTGYAVYKGTAWRNQLSEKLEIRQAAEQQYRLARQLRSENAAKVAFETRIGLATRDIENKLQFNHQSGEQALFKRTLERSISDFSKLGVLPTRVLAVTRNPVVGALPQIAFSYGLSEQHKKWFLTLAQRHYLSCTGENNPNLISSLSNQLEKAPGGNSSFNNISSEEIGGSSLQMNGESRELFYCNYVRAMPDELRKLPLPGNNWQMANLDDSLHRIVGIIMFAVPEAAVRNNLKFMASSYAEPGLEIAIKDQGGNLYKSLKFPEKNAGNVVANEEIVINDQSCNLLVARSVSENGKTPLRPVLLVVILAVACAIFYAGKTIIYGSALSHSIQLKLVFSILLTALVPLLTVWFVSESFVFENHQALLHQQKTELQRYLDGYELRHYYYQQVVSRQLKEFSKKPQILALARELDKNPSAVEPRARLSRFFADAFAQIDLDGDWSSNATARDVLLISRKNWEMAHHQRKNEGSDAFASFLSQIGRHILSGISSGDMLEQNAETLKMKDLKSEMLFDSFMQSIRSNFGDEACIMLNSAFEQLVEFEITTGAAVIMTIPLPSAQNPEFAIMWMVSLSSGGFMNRIAMHNRGPFAAFTIEYQRYGKLMSQFHPVWGLDLSKAAAWISSSNLPVSFDGSTGAERISIEGRPGIKQFNNFLIAAASQTPIEGTTEMIRQYLGYFMLLAVLLFLVIGHQTASDIIIPVASLAEGMWHISQQNYFFRINLDRHDELGQLCASYDRFAKGLAEKEVMGKMLSRGARLAAGGADGIVISSRSEFVFIFIGSPDFAARLNNEDTGLLFTKLKEQVTMLCRIILEEGGDIDKLMGDKILGVFSAGDVNKVSARLAAINAAAKIIQAEKDGQLHFPLAIGINAGEVISGMLGFGAKRDFTVIGDAVNVSARIQKEAEKLPDNRCLFSDSFVAGLPETTGFTLHAKASLKGKSETIDLYRSTPQKLKVV